MGKLTSNEFRILVDTICNKINQADKEHARIILESPEYKNFERDYSDASVRKLKSLAQAQEKINEQTKKLAEKLREKKISVGTQAPASSLLSAYINHKKKQRFGNPSSMRVRLRSMVESEVLLAQNETDLEAMINRIIQKLT